MVFVSMALRLRINIEAANMVESFGNYTRHRIAPVVRRTSEGYEVIFAPTISGQSVAHAFMRALVDIINNMNSNSNVKLPLCDDCKNYSIIGGFLKRSSNVTTPVDERVKTCVVDDVTGFMAAKKKVSSVVRRTSRIMFSYLVPDADVAKSTVMPQFHVRFDNRSADNDIFQVESGSAIYMSSVAIDVDGIGLLSSNSDKDPSYVENRDKRIEAVFNALMAVYSGNYLGAKKARYLPIIDILGGVAAVSDPIPFSVSPPKFMDYVKDTYQRASKYAQAINGENIYITYFDKEGIIQQDSCSQNNGQVSCEKRENLEDMIQKVKEKVLEKVKPLKGTNK